MSKHRLLVIEDDKNIAELVCHVGEGMGFEVRATCDLDEIPKLYERFEPDIIVLDVVMPEMDGFEVLNFLHKRRCTSRIIVVSGDASYRPLASSMAKDLSLHIDATVAKPFRLAEIRKPLEAIQRTLMPKHSNPYFANYRLLAIDDSPNITKVICQAAEELGFETRSTTGMLAATIYDQYKPHVIMLDLLMPGMDGLEFMEYLESQNSRSHIVILSGTSEEYRQNSHSFGKSRGLVIEGHMPKPFRLQDVRDRLEKILMNLHVKAISGRKMA